MKPDLDAPLRPSDVDAAPVVLPEPVAWGLFAKVEDGGWMLQHPVRFTEKDVKADRSMYERSTALDVRPLHTADQLRAAVLAERAARRQATVLRTGLTEDQMDALAETIHAQGLQLVESARVLRVARDALESTQQSFAEMIGRKPAFVEDSIAMANEALATIRAHLGEA